MHMDDKTWLGMHAEVLGRDAIVAARRCDHCPGILDRQAIHAASCPCAHGYRDGTHHAVRDALVRAFAAGAAQVAGAKAEPYLHDHPDIFGARLEGGVDKKADVLVINAAGHHTFIDVTVGWEAQLRPEEEVLDPGRAERLVTEDKRSKYNAAYAGSGSVVHTLFVNAHGGIKGRSAKLIRWLARVRAQELVSATSRRDYIGTYINLITTLREEASLGFWRKRAEMRARVLEVAAAVIPGMGREGQGDQGGQGGDFVAPVA